MADTVLNGTIVRIRADKGFGFIRADQTGLEYFFHRTTCAPPTRFELINAGDRATFTIGESLKGPRAEMVVVGPYL